jgi:hypothetical protein
MLMKWTLLPGRMRTLRGRRELLDVFRRERNGGLGRRSRQAPQHYRAASQARLPQHAPRAYPPSAVEAAWSPLAAAVTLAQVHFTYAENSDIPVLGTRKRN